MWYCVVHCFGGYDNLSCLVLSSEWMEVAGSPGTRYLSTKLHSVTSERNVILAFMSRQTKVYCSAVPFIGMALFYAKMSLKDYLHSFNFVISLLLKSAMLDCWPVCRLIKFSWLKRIYSVLLIIYEYIFTFCSGSQKLHITVRKHHSC